MKISSIAAIAKGTRGLGLKNSLLFQIPEDMKRFKELTNGHPVIMGRRTWESLPERFRPLPNRTNIIMNNDAVLSTEGATIVATFDEAIEVAKNAPGNDEVFVIGGGQIYAFTLPHVERLYLTVVDQTAEADTFFPAYENDFNLMSEEKHEGFSFQILDRK